MSKIYFDEEGYVELLRDILENGVEIPDRTGVGSIAVFDRKIVYNVGKQFPFPTIRDCPLRLAFEEMQMFLNGETQTKVLEKKGINFWKGNTSRGFLDARNLEHLHEGDMGKAYGAQWRGFGPQQFDQFAEIMRLLVTDKYSRRMLTTLWNPAESHMMALTPCWFQHQFVVLPSKNGDVLHMKLSNRSLDAVFGERFATQQYAFYLTAVAKMLGMKVGDLSCDLTHVHIYNNQIEYAKELVTRDLGKQGTLKINKDLKRPDDILALTWEDIEIVGLEVNKTPFKTPRPAMAV